MAVQFFPTCCYYPTTVLMVDDNQDLLLDLSLALSPHYKTKHSTSAQQILKLLKAQGNTIESLVKSLVSTPEEFFDPHKTLVNIDVPAIRKQLYADPVRFDQHLVLVIDYAMPEMNGLELAKKIRSESHLPVKIIMLTGEADQATAIRAFNDKLIDRFMVKSAPDYIETLLVYIQELHLDYFEGVSNLILGASAEINKAVRNDPAFIRLFREVIERHHITEYYLVEEPASYLLLNDKKQPFWLLVATEEDVQTTLELARDEEDVPQPIIQALEKREKLVYFPDEKSKLAPANSWVYQDAKPLSNKDGVFYAVIEGDKNYPLNLPAVIAYQDFLMSD